MTRKRKYAILILSLITLCACRNKVTITGEYIYSSSWEKGKYEGFKIAKIRLRDSTISVFDKDFNHYLLDNYTIDSSFCFGAGGNNSNTISIDKMPKVYFARESKYYIWYKCFNIEETQKSIGNLQPNTWYLITGLLGTEDFFVFIDSNGGSHSYGSGPTNW